MDPKSDGPIVAIKLGPNGRVWKLEAKIKRIHLKPVGKKRHDVTSRVRRFVAFLGQVRSGEKGCQDSDQVGHIIGDCLGGPHNRTYNFFPQGHWCNETYYTEVEKPIYDYLSNAKDGAYVEMSVRMVYVDYVPGLSPHRPKLIGVKLRFSDGTEKEFIYVNG